MKKLIILPLLLLLFTCRKTDNFLQPDSSLILKTGYMCGWGAGEDSLVISATKIYYVYRVPSKSQQPVIRQTRAITQSEINDINQALNIDTFNNLEFNTCNICVDGCDEWITIKNQKSDHNIRYSKGQKIEGIADLQTILDKIREGFH